jgi:hypothetical protein
MHKSILKKEEPMKLNFFLFILAHCSIFFNCHGMEQKDLNPIKTAVNKAFENFGLCANLFSTFVDNHEITPDENVWRWHRENQTICFTRDICANPDLLEFAAYCAAADVKNNGYLKSQLARLATGTLSVAVPVAASYLSSESYDKCVVRALTSIPGLALAIDFASLRTKLFDTVDNRLAKTAFRLACQKLIEGKKYKTLAAYCAYAKTIKHMPLGQEEQLAIIRKALDQDSKLIVDVAMHAKLEVQILHKKKSDNQYTQELCARATYP